MKYNVYRIAFFLSLATSGLLGRIYRASMEHSGDFCQGDTPINSFFGLNEQPPDSNRETLGAIRENNLLETTPVITQSSENLGDNTAMYLLKLLDIHRKMSGYEQPFGDFTNSHKTTD